jgi:hypothetical protein
VWLCVVLRGAVLRTAVLWIIKMNVYLGEELEGKWLELH